MFTWAQVCARWLNPSPGDREIHTTHNTHVLTNRNSVTSGAWGCEVQMMRLLASPGNSLRMPLDSLPPPNAKDSCWNERGHLCPCQRGEGLILSLYLSLNHWTGNTWALRSETVQLDYRDCGEYAVSHHWLGIVRMKSEQLELLWNYYVLGIAIVTVSFTFSILSLSLFSNSQDQKSEVDIFICTLKVERVEV